MAFNVVLVNYIVSVILTTTMAYNQDAFPYFYQRYTSSQYRRADEDQNIQNDSNQQRSSVRTANDRSIPYRTDVQKLQEEPRRVRPSDEMLRNGNTTFNYASLPILSNRAGTTESDSTIVFPGPASRRSMFVPEVSAECEAMGFCEDVPNYPQSHVDKLIDEAGPSVAKYFSMDTVIPELTQRRGSEEDKKELCEYKEEMKYPRAARNIDGKWFFVLNKEKYRVQGFKTEICQKSNKPCEKIMYINNAYKHECGQKMSQTLMVGVGDNGEMVLHTVMTPTCCTCFIKAIPYSEFSTSEEY